MYIFKYTIYAYTVHWNVQTDIKTKRTLKKLSIFRYIKFTIFRKINNGDKRKN